MAGKGGETGDLLMMVLPVRGGRGIPGESGSVTDIPQTALDSALLKGFQRGYMFEVSSFKFGVRSQKDEKKDQNKMMQALYDAHAQLARFTQGIAPTVSMRAPKTPDPKRLEEDGTKTNEAMSCPVEPVSFERPIDSASALLLNYCVTCTTLAGAIMVKRKPAGGPAAGLPYLRLEFIDVLITNMSWSNDEPVKESCTLIARAVNVLYRPQTPDGALGPVMQGFWSRVPGNAESLF